MVKQETRKKGSAHTLHPRVVDVEEGKMIAVRNRE